MANLDPERDDLEVLASDYMERLRRGESPSITAYAEAHPKLAADIREVFPTIAAAEKLKSTRLRGTAPPGVAAAPARVPSVGMTLGKYALLEGIGQGSLGTVWRSLHPDLGIPVAVKVLRPELVGRSADHVERFLREARTAAQLNHPHVVRVFDAGYDQGLYFLVMEFVEGGSLGDLLRQADGKMPVARAVEVATAVAEALRAAAELGIVHRDIKPDNILLDQRGTPKLADLGLARQVAAGAGAEVTGSGVGLGTPLYVAPEQAMGQATPDARADIYSLGATLYHMVTGAPPFTSGTAYQIVHQHAHVPLVDPRERNPEVPEELACIIRRMLAKDPGDRYPAAADLLADLARLKAGLAPAPWTPRQADPAWHRWVPMAALAALAAVTLATTLWQVAVRRRGARPPPGTRPAAEAWSPAGERRCPPGAGPAADRPGGPGRPGGRPVDAAGEVAPTDWGVCGNPAQRDGPPRPLNARDHEFANGVLRFLAKRDGRPTVLAYGAAMLSGPFSLTVEARNLVECGISAPPRGAPPGEPSECRILLRDPAVPPAPPGPWQTIQIRREHGDLTCTVDGRPAYAVEGERSVAGRFVITLPPGVTCELRRFSLAAGEAPPRPPRQEDLPPPRPPP